MMPQWLSADIVAYWMKGDCSDFDVWKIRSPSFNLSADVCPEQYLMPRNNTTMTNSIPKTFFFFILDMFKCLFIGEYAVDSFQPLFTLFLHTLQNYHIISKPRFPFSLTVWTTPFIVWNQGESLVRSFLIIFSLLLFCWLTILLYFCRKIKMPRKACVHSSPRDSHVSQSDG